MLIFLTRRAIDGPGPGEAWASESPEVVTQGFCGLSS
jgi:hypothetical protein